MSPHEPERTRTNRMTEPIDMNPTPQSDNAPADPSSLIRAFDADGREVLITRDEWRDKVLPGAIEQRWNDADALAALIIQFLNDDFIDDMVGPAERLVQLDQNTERAVVLQAIVYLKQGRLDDSERVLADFCARHGDTGIVLTNLAKVHAERGDDDKTLDTLWRALQRDPNQDNGLGWYEAIHRDVGGDAAGVGAMQRVAALPGSWRARLWLARGELGAHNYAGALTLYREALVQAGEPVPGDLLMQMTGDLGNAGRIPDIVQMAAPHYRAAAHGPQVGNNLIKAYLLLGQPDPARHILDALHALGQPEWKEHLAYWDAELARLQAQRGASGSAP